MSAETPVSFEFFPPRSDEQRLVLNGTVDKLSRLSPQYLSVTFGAGGSTLDATRSTVLDIHRRGRTPAAPHISCMAPDQAAVDALLTEYREAGINRLVVLRGDRPSGQSGAGPFRYASDLVAHIRRAHGDAFHIEVACYPECHPESDSPESELRWFRRKVEAGADGAITQYFFNADGYFRLLDDCRRVGLDIPIVPGIMPITNYRQLARFSSMCGAEIPQWIARRLQSYGEDGASIRQFGEEVVTDLCRRLLDGGAPGLHFYTLNRANATLRILQGLNLA